MLFVSIFEIPDGRIKKPRMRLTTDAGHGKLIKSNIVSNIDASLSVFFQKKFSNAFSGLLPLCH